ncbi:ribonuclease III [Candidatus Gracilibacteria bacterium]|nr:ribonuclease III [Candidatus Gracilibacteria bacterium]
MPRTSLRFDRKEFESRVDILLTSLQILPVSRQLYSLAFVHRSVLNESHEGYSASNERLEYLGDAILELVVTERLYHDYMDKTEGELTDIRSALVRGRNLASIALSLDFSGAIQLSRGESIAGGHENPYILANTFEALIGALYLDQGMEVTREFLLRHVYSTLLNILEKALYVDPKSYLQEFTQGVWGVTPDYAVVDEVGEDHNKSYIVAVLLDNIELGRGKGSSKKKSEQDAAENALSKKHGWEENITLQKKIGV